MGLRKKTAATDPREKRNGKQDRGIVGLRKKKIAAGPREEYKPVKDKHNNLQRIGGKNAIDM